MSAEDYHDVPGLFGGGNYTPKSYTCNFCNAAITFHNRKAFNKDGTPHRCKSTQTQPQKQEIPNQATLFAMAAMNAIVNASIQKVGVDYIHTMNFYDVADTSWKIAADMVSKEQAYREEFGTGI